MIKQDRRYKANSAIVQDENRLQGDDQGSSEELSIESVSLSLNSEELKFKIIKEKTYAVMNPNSSTEVSIRSDIVRDFEFASERARRLEEEKKIKKRLRPSASLLEREDY